MATYRLRIGHRPNAFSMETAAGSYTLTGQQATLTTTQAGAGYDINAKVAALPAAFSALTLPTAPTLTGTYTATTAAALTSYLAINGADITVAAGTYVGNFSTSALDQRITFQAGAWIDTPSPTGYVSATGFQVNGAARRIHLRGPGGVRLGSFYTVAGCQDVRIDTEFSCTTRTNSSTADWDTIGFDGTRILIEKSTFTSRTYCGYSARAVDMVLANSQFITSVGGQATHRCVAGTRCVVMDCRLTNPTHHSLRSNMSASSATATDLLYWARNQIEPGGGLGISIAFISGTTNPQVNRGWIVDNRIYNGQCRLEDAPVSTTLVVTGNRIYSNTGWHTFIIDGDAGDGWTVSDNVKSAGVSIPAWNYQ